jgi:hypothetical protein
MTRVSTAPELWRLVCDLCASTFIGAAVEPMLRGYAHGVDLAGGSPALALRTYVAERLRPAAERDRVQGLKALRCVLAHVRGETIGRIQANEDGYDYLRHIETARGPTDA